MSLNSHTIGKIKIIKEISYFDNCGKEDDKYLLVPNWMDAITLLNSLEMENLKNNASNSIRASIPTQVFQTWNIKVREIKSRLMEWSRSKGFEDHYLKILPNKYFLKIRDAMEYDIVTYLMEIEYREYVMADKYYDVAFNVYLDGHFPCGWSGNNYNERIIVY